MYFSKSHQKQEVISLKSVIRNHFSIALCLLAAFLLWTGLVCTVDVRAIGPQGSSVGFSALNQLFHNFTGVHMSLYFITDWLSLVPLCFVAGFAILGLVQWIQRKQLLLVDSSILILGGFYIVTISIYLLFETVVVNYRPILINGFLEASYPSSTTILVICVMSTATMQLNGRIKNPALKKGLAAIITAFMVFMVLGRLLSGVHWLTDIVAGGLLSAGLVMMYHAIIDRTRK